MHCIILDGLAPELLPCFISSYCYKSYIHFLMCVKEKGSVFIMIGVQPTVSSVGFDC